VPPDGVGALLGRLDPAEILAPAALPLADWEAKRAPAATALPPLIARRRLAEAFATASLEAFGEFSDAEAIAAALALEYVRATQAGAMPRLSRPAPQGSAGRMAIDAATRASLEIGRARDGGTRHTLLGAVQRTLGAAGARLLAQWLAAPLTDAAAIAERQDAWSWLLANPNAAEKLRTALRAAPDMARALGRLSLARGAPRDLAAIRDGAAAAGLAAAALPGPLPAALQQAERALAGKHSLHATLAAALAEKLPARVDEGGSIAAGFDAELDAERRLRDDARRVLATLQTQYAQRYGVASLRIRHHAQLGYVIEAPAAAVEKLRAEPALTLRQGMANAARFSTAELSELDRRIAEAAERAAERERAVFAALVAATLAEGAALAAAAEALAALDALQSCAKLAESGTWCRPAVTDGADFCITAGRHPVVEAALAGTGAFVPNDCDLSPDRRILLLTGPNMAGKSTYLRQNALAAVLAQTGLPVPAAAARIGIVDRLFSRVGAADDLARGRSTFMVEMTETAAILHQAGPRSLVLVDEIGRGTATLDGLAIAWAVLEALHSQVRARTIFATHFHELAHLATELPRLSPHTMRVKEWKREVIFLHEVAAGAAGLLAALEQRGAHLTKDAELPLFAHAAPPAVPSGGDGAAHAGAEHPLIAALAALNLDEMTPKVALETLYRLHSMLAAEGTCSTGC